MEVERIIGSYTSNIEGPLLFVTAGIHGNEPSGVIALQKIFEELDQSKPIIKGTFIGVCGNKLALTKNLRYIDQDLNRTWTEENLKSTSGMSHEYHEMHAIIRVLNYFKEKSQTKSYFLDCHTTSSPSAPFISVQDVQDNYTWAQRFPAQIVMGLSDIITGDIDHYLSRIGLTGFVFEAGQHTSRDAVENQLGMIWLALQQACNINFSDLSEYPKSITHLQSENQSKQKTFKILYRHELKDRDTFVMESGFENFSKIHKNQLLAIQNGKEIRSNWDAYIFMPLYQSQGNDGFFVIDEVSSAIP